MALDELSVFSDLRNSTDPKCIFNPPEQDEDFESMEFNERNKVVQWIAYRIIGPGVVGIGLLGNVLNLIVLTRPSLKGVTYTYLIGLACSDIGVLLCAVPMMIRQSRSGRENSWVVTFFYSHLEYPLANTFMACSIFIVLCLTVDRFASVWLPTRFKSFHTAANSRRAMGIAAAIAVLISVPLSLINRICVVNQPPENDTSFFFTENVEVTQQFWWRIYIYTAEVIVRFGPATILAMLNFLIIWKFRQITIGKRRLLLGDPRGENENPHSNGKSDQMLLREEKVARKIYKEEKRLVTLLSAIVLLFFVTTTPVAILGISYSSSLDKNLYYQIFRAVANVLELCNFSLNFYIYFLCCKEFRKKFLSFFNIILPKEAKNNNFQSIALAAEPTQNNAPTQL